eukprot:g63821.t1
MIARYDCIVFNFPHVGGSEKEDVERNRTLLLGFFASAKTLLNKKGQIHVSLRNNPFYDSWQVATQAKTCGLKLLTTRRFDSDMFPGYRNCRTNPAARAAPELDSALQYVFAVSAASSASGKQGRSTKRQKKQEQVTQLAGKERLSAAASQQTKSMGKNKWLCTICDVRCLTEKRWNGHNNSKKHAKKYKLWVRSQGSGVKPPVANLPPGRPKHGSGVKPPAVANLPPGGPKHGKGVISTAHLPDQAKTATTEIAHPINARKKKQVKLATELSHRPKQAYGQPSAQKKEVNRATQHRGKEPSGAAATTHRAKVVKKATPHHPKHGHGPSLIHSPNQGPGLPGVAANLKDTSLDQGGRPSAENGGGLSKQSKQQLLQKETKSLVGFLILRLPYFRLLRHRQNSSWRGDPDSAITLLRRDHRVKSLSHCSTNLADS